MKTHRYFITLTVIIILLTGTLALSLQNLFTWGGPGYDPALKKSFRYSLRPHDNDDALMDIWVDAKETTEEVAEIRLIPANGEAVSSKTCWAAMRHITSPWACSFQKSEVQKLTGTGNIETYDHSQRMLLKDEIDFDALDKFIEKSGNPGRKNE